MNVSWNSGHIPDPDLLLAADGELSPVRAAEIRDHLAECPSCRLRDAALRATMADVVQAQRLEFDRQLPSMETSTSRLQARLAQAPSSTATARPPPSPGWAAAAILLVGVGAMWYGWTVRRARAPEAEFAPNYRVDAGLCARVEPGRGMFRAGPRGAQPRGFRFRRAGSFPPLRHTQSSASILRIGLSDSAGARRHRRSPQSVAPALFRRRLERTRKGRAGRSPANPGLRGQSGSRHRAARSGERLDRGIQEVFPHRHSAAGSRRLRQRSPLGVARGQYRRTTFL